MMNSKKVVADTGGVQKESDILAGACITIIVFFFAPAEEVIVKVKI
jgi:hypothetical protein